MEVGDSGFTRTGEVLEARIADARCWHSWRQGLIHSSIRLQLEIQYDDGRSPWSSCSGATATATAPNEASPATAALRRAVRLGPGATERHASPKAIIKEDFSNGTTPLFIQAAS